MRGKAISGLFDNEDYAAWGTQPGSPNYVDPNWSNYPNPIWSEQYPYGSGGSATKTMSWLDVLNTGIKSTGSILGTRYSVPQLNPGQLIQTGPNGQSLMYQGTAGNMQMPSLSSMGGSGGGMLPLLLVGGVVLFMMMGNKKAS